MKVSAVIFDFDGVIVDTEHLHYRAFQELLAPLGMGCSWEEYREVYMGFDDRDALAEFYRRAERKLNPDKLTPMIEAKARIFELLVKREKPEAYPGIVPLVNRLAAELPLALCSGALRRDIDPILAQLNITDCFTVIVTADDVRKSKPDPEGYFLATKMLRHKFPKIINGAGDIFAVEDTPTGVTAAQAAGLHVLAITNNFSASDLEAADLIVNGIDPTDWDAIFHGSTTAGT